MLLSVSRALTGTPRRIGNRICLTCRSVSIDSKKHEPGALQYTFDFRFFKDKRHLYRESILQRGLPGDQQESLLTSLDQITRLHDEYLGMLYQRNQVQAKRRKLTASIVSLPAEEKAKVIQDASQYKDQFQNLDKTCSELLNQAKILARALPNLVDPSCGPQTVEIINPQSKIEPTKDTLDHLEIGTRLGILDLACAAKVSGTSWYYLKGDGALLENALIQYALEKAIEAGFKFIIPPSIVRTEIANACGFMPRDTNGEQQTYRLLPDGARTLCATAEIPLAGLGLDKTFTTEKSCRDDESLISSAIKVVGLSRSYRAEAGSHGTESKGLYRVHEFTKVELFIWVPTQAAAEQVLEMDLLNFQRQIIQELGICARVLNMPPDDLGAPAYKKYDIEAWMPGRGSWGEVTSASNCLDYQSRRMNTSFALRDDKATRKFACTLNGTAVAVPRMIIALLENFYDARRNAVMIPHVLRKWMGNKEYIEAQNDQF